MEENVSKSWKTEKQFRENAKRFYVFCKKHDRMPYLEGVFIETACEAYNILKNGGRPTVVLIEETAITTIKEIYPEMTEKEISKKIKDVFKGEKIKVLFNEDWFDFCCKFRYDVSPNYSYWNAYCVNITHKLYVCESKYQTSFRNFQKNIAYLVLTIELL